MTWSEKMTIRIAILDLYEGRANEGMRCIRQIITRWSGMNNLDARWDEFDVRLRNEIPDTSYDIYISSGGPGSPLDSEGSDWETTYFKWLQKVEKWNNDPLNTQKKFVFFICHSFQLACRHYKLAHVIKRRSTAFGVFPVHLLSYGKIEPVFDGLPDPFYAVDSRDYQVVQPNHQKLHEMRGVILAIEKERKHVPLERAIMAIRFNDYMIGSQFHPEADAVGMTMYLLRDDKKQLVIAEHGEEKWQSMIDHLNDPDKILLTYSQVLPNFLDQAVEHLMEEAI